MTTSTVAALLTILGFSLYDTIIVFDRVRENIPRMPSAAFSQIVNRSHVRGAHPVAGDELLHAAAGARAVLLRRRDAAGLRVRADRRHRVGHLLVGLHRHPGARALEGARAGLPRAASGAITRALGLRARRTRPPTGGGPVDVAPAEPRGGRRRAIDAPQDPSQGVSRAEFDDMVARPRRRRGAEAASPPPRPARGRPAGGRPRAGARGGEPPPPPAGRPRRLRARRRAGDRGAEAAQKPRNRKHGRPR